MYKIILKNYHLLLNSYIYVENDLKKNRILIYN